MKRTSSLAILLGLALSAPAFAAGGNVQVSVNATGILLVEGDGGDNEIAITPDGVGAFTVTGLNGTTVNLTAAVPLTGVRSIRATMGAGDDRVEVNSGRIRGDLRIGLDDGTDVCVLNNVRVRRRTSVVGGNGSDRILTAGTAIFRNSFTAVCNDGDDVVDVQGAICFGRTRIDTGNGADTVTCKDSDFDDLDVRTGAGADTLDIDDCDLDDDLKVDMGEDADHVSLDDTNFDDRVDVSGGGGSSDSKTVHGGNDFDRIPRFKRFED